MKKLAALIETEEYNAETDEIKNVSECKAFPENKTITLIESKRFPKKVKDCKPFIGVSILFLCLSIILIGTMIYFHLKSKNNNVFLC